jgi:hypothetical protein
VELGADLVRLHPARALELSIVETVHLLGAVRLVGTLEPSFGDIVQGASGVRAPVREVPHDVPDGPALRVHPRPLD